ncbi:MAG: DUF445 domain-containing protein [Flavipsychrobacter sp.]|jgi:uncharacterized membrane protein YheB (UPF0754 family)|nr:DUF445 family protein [Chitinophagales bacterium]
MLYLIPFISAFIGWFTNWIAIKMLFHPKNPVKVLGITIQGIFPKRQQQFAQKLGVLVATELLHFNDIASKLKDPKQLESVTPYIEEHIDTFLRVKLQEKLPVVSMFIGDSTIGKLKEGMMEEINGLLPEVIGKYADNLSQKMDIEKMVTDKVANFSSDKLEEILTAIMSKEFRFVEIIGGVLGFIIGVIQIFLTQL